MALAIRHPLIIATVLLSRILLVSAGCETCGSTSWLECGTFTNSCGQKLNCGPCPDGGACYGNQCCGKCTDGSKCGQSFDECYNVISCGTCPAGQGCMATYPNGDSWGTGPDNKGPFYCQNCGNCTTLGFQCSGKNKCGNTINCGSCAAGKTCCNGQCYSTPVASCHDIYSDWCSSCSDNGAECGTINVAQKQGADYCSPSSLSCGTCPTGKKCANNKCVPCKTCSQLGYKCGTAFDDCGNQISCGSCGIGMTCKNNQCQRPAIDVILVCRWPFPICPCPWGMLDFNSATNPPLDLPWTLSAWVNVGDVGDWAQMVFHHGLPTRDGVGLQIGAGARGSNPRVGIMFGGLGLAMSEASFKPNTWTFVSAVKQSTLASKRQSLGEYWNIYFYGRLAGSVRYGQSALPPTKRFYIAGVDGRGTTNYFGDMDLLQTWTIPRSPAELVQDAQHGQLTGFERGLAFYFPFTEGDGNLTRSVGTNYGLGRVRFTGPMDLAPTPGIPNLPPTFTPGGDVRVFTGDSFSGRWASDVSPGSAEESWQEVFFVTRAANPNAFRRQPTISPSGVLSFALNEGFVGDFLVTTVAQDTGGNGYSASRGVVSIDCDPRFFAGNPVFLVNWSL
eukprot:TRINITY_DN3487_c0_g1_i3.p1 TRINITY_DN3487_c0_g1~~TRINITY_DN3487_c0_g1_i3.p1  ORF type:complete len:617 (-),score=146.16 TRINITY_DN3487_c0_g1_i3:267-2117(-)